MSGTDALIHAAYVPAGDGPHPTLIALHGWGASALDLLGLAPHLGGGRLLVLCPQGPIAVPIAPGMQGYGWFPLSMGAPPDPQAFGRATQSLEAFITDAIHRYPIAPQRLALLGFSQGGVMAYALAHRGRIRICALAALSTWLVGGLVDADGDGAGFADLPVLVQHGVRDELIRVERGREAVERLRALRAQVVYREYDMGHEISPPSLRDLAGFLETHLISAVVRP